MAELDGRAEPDQATRLDVPDRLVPDQLARRVGRAAQQHRIAVPFRGSQEQQHPGIGIERLSPRVEEPGETVPDRQRVGQRIDPTELVDRQRGGKLDQSQRVALAPRQR